VSLSLTSSITYNKLYKQIQQFINSQIHHIHDSLCANQLTSWQTLLPSLEQYLFATRCRLSLLPSVGC